MASNFDSDLQDTIEWGRKRLVDFSVGKIQIVSFDRSNNCGNIDTKMVLSEKSYLMRLGLYFSSKLDLGSYIDSIIISDSIKHPLRNFMEQMLEDLEIFKIYMFHSGYRKCI